MILIPFLISENLFQISSDIAEFIFSQLIVIFGKFKFEQYRNRSIHRTLIFGNKFTINAW